jgi:serine/threonine protein kinase
MEGLSAPQSFKQFLAISPNFLSELGLISPTNNGLIILSSCPFFQVGLHYLNTSSAGVIIHRDVKSTNILLNEQKGQLERIIDPLLGGEINPDSLRKFGEIAENCLKDCGADRPSMLDVQWDLEYALQLQQTTLHKEAHVGKPLDRTALHVVVLWGTIGGYGTIYLFSQCSTRMVNLVMSNGALIL